MDGGSYDSTDVVGDLALAKHHPIKGITGRYKGRQPYANPPLDSPYLV